MNRFIICIILIGVFSGGCDPKDLKKKDFVCIKEKCFEVELARTDQGRSKGLQEREALAKNSGMLFIFPNRDYHSFWMKDTYIALDMIWLDHAQRVVHIEDNVPPCNNDACPVYTPLQEALYVLEINAGEAQEAGISLNDRADFNIKSINL